MAYDAEGIRARRPVYGIRGVDHMETSVCHGSKRIPRVDRDSPDGAVSKSRHPYNLVWAWGVLVIITASGSAETARIIAGCRWSF